MQTSDRSNNNESKNDFTISDIINSIYKSEGIKGFYKGIESKLLQSVLTAALLFGFKEQFYQLAQILLRRIVKK